MEEGGFAGLRRKGVVPSCWKAGAAAGLAGCGADALWLWPLNCQDCLSVRQVTRRTSLKLPRKVVLGRHSARRSTEYNRAQPRA